MTDSKSQQGGQAKPCDHKFIDSACCLKCGKSYDELRQEYESELAKIRDDEPSPPPSETVGERPGYVGNPACVGCGTTLLGPLDSTGRCHRCWLPKDRLASPADSEPSDEGPTFPTDLCAVCGWPMSAQCECFLKRRVEPNYKDGWLHGHAAGRAAVEGENAELRRERDEYKAGELYQAGVAVDYLQRVSDLESSLASARAEAEGMKAERDAALVDAAEFKSAFQQEVKVTDGLLTQLSRAQATIEAWQPSMLALRKRRECEEKVGLAGMCIEVEHDDDLMEAYEAIPEALRPTLAGPEKP